MTKKKETQPTVTVTIAFADGAQDETTYAWDTTKNAETHAVAAKMATHLMDAVVSKIIEVGGAEA